MSADDESSTSHIESISHNASAVGASSNDAPSIYGKRFWTAYVANLLLVAANALTFRFSDFVAHLGGTETTTGLLVSFGVVGALFFRLFSGGWMDRFGIGRIWVSGAVLFVVGAFMMFASSELGWWLFAARLAFTTGLTTLFSCSMAHIQNEAPPSHRTEVIASLGSSGFLGLMVGTIAADAIFRVFPGQTDATFQALFSAAMICGILYVVIVTALTRKDAKPDQSHPPRNVLALLREYFPGPVIYCGFFMGGGFAVSSNFLARFVDARGFSGISWFFVAYALSAFTFRIVSRTWSRRFGRHRLILIGMTAQSIGFIAIPFVLSEWMLSIPAVAIGFGHALLFPAVVSLGTATYPQQYRGTGTTLILGTFELGQLVISPLAGAVIDAYGFRPMFILTGATALVVAAGFGLSVRGQVDNDGVVAPQPSVS